MKITEIIVHVLKSPLDTPFAFSQGWVRERSATLVEVKTDTGLAGWGEAFAQGLEAPGIAAAVIDNAAKRFPIDRSNIFVSGYSYGSAMAWRYACENGAGVRALLAVSGTLDQYENCETAPQEVRHVHGTSDNVMNFPFGPGGDTTYPVALWRERMGCTEVTGSEDYSTTSKDNFKRVIWGNCEAGKVGLDVHSRGHFIPRGWFARQLDDLLAPDL